MNIEELVNDLDPITLLRFKEYLINNLTELCSKKNSNSKIISAFKTDILKCDKCGFKLSKNGKTKNGIQKYICPFCNKTYTETTNSVIYHSKLPFTIWAKVIDNLVNGFSLRRISEENNISLKTSFNLRHKVLNALKSFIDKMELVDKAEADEKYFSINLKGTKTKNMPRSSKKRTSSNNTSIRGISHHKVCVISAIDKNNDLILKIGGLGKCQKTMLENILSKKVKNLKELNSDGDKSYLSFCSKHNIISNSVPSGQHSNGSININSINAVHSQLETWLSKFRGVSTRHLQDYLNWFSYIFMMKKRFNLSNLIFESYYNIIIDCNYIKSNDIFKIKMPIDLNVAYAEYHYQS